MSQVPSITPLSPPMQWPILSSTYSSTGPSHYQQRPPSDRPHTLLTIAPILVQCGTSVVMWPVPRPPVHTVHVSTTCNRVLVFRCDMNTGTLFLLSHNHTVVQCSTDVLQNGSLTTVAGSGHHYIALIKPKDSVVIYKAIFKISRRTGTFQCSQR